MRLFEAFESTTPSLPPRIEERYSGLVWFPEHTETNELPSSRDKHVYFDKSKYYKQQSASLAEGEGVLGLSAYNFQRLHDSVILFRQQ